MTTTELFDGFEKLKVLVVGDVMLDAYIYGEAQRLSPEAPVPVVTAKKRDYRAGGAANVALNCRALGAKVAVAGVIGQDENGQRLKALLQEAEIDTVLLQEDETRPTTTKMRILSRHQQLLRVDWEALEEFAQRQEHLFIEKVLKYLQIQKPDVLIIEDYDKGLLKENIIQQIIRHAMVLNIPIAVDPKKKHFLSFKGVTIFKPNLKEVEEGLNIQIKNLNLEKLEEVHQRLKEQLNHSITFLTLSEQGVYVHAENKKDWLPSHHRNIADVSGAGDTVIAVAAMVYALSKDVQKMAAWANLAGGLVCEEVGVVPINKKRLETEINNHQL